MIHSEVVMNFLVRLWGLILSYFKYAIEWLMRVCCPPSADFLVMGPRNSGKKTLMSVLQRQYLQCELDTTIDNKIENQVTTERPSTKRIKQISQESTSSLPSDFTQKLLISGKKHQVLMLNGSSDEQITEALRQCPNQGKGQGLIFIIDVSDIINMNHGLHYLRSVLQDDRFEHLRVLVLANKCDLLRDDFLEPMDIVLYLKLTDLLFSEPLSSQPRMRVQKCSLAQNWGYQQGLQQLVEDMQQGS